MKITSNRRSALFKQIVVFTECRPHNGKVPIIEVSHYGFTGLVVNLLLKQGQVCKHIIEYLVWFWLRLFQVVFKQARLMIRWYVVVEQAYWKVRSPTHISVNVIEWQTYIIVYVSLLQEDKVINEVAHYNLYQVAFLSVTNFGLEYVRCDDFLRTVGLLVRDPHVLKHFWPTEIDGLQLVLKECEKFFPVVFQPVMDIYTSVASHSEYYVNEVMYTVLTNNKSCSVDNVSHLVNEPTVICVPLCTVKCIKFQLIGNAGF